jgi:hypothetical protein
MGWKLGLRRWTVIAWVAVAGADGAQGAAANFGVTLSRTAPREVSWPSETGFVYTLESTPSLTRPDWRPVGNGQNGTGGTLKLGVGLDGSGRFFRVVRTLPAGPTISPQAVDPIPGQVLGPSTIIGSPFLGLQFTIPTNWKGGVREGTSTMLYASDTEAGLVLGFIALSGDGPKITRALSDAIPVGQFGGFQSAGTPRISGSQLTAEWNGAGFDDQFNSLQGATARCQAVLHPSGGLVAFVGFFTEPNRRVMERVLNDFTQSVVTVPRRTRTDLVDIISGKAFLWVKASNAGNGGNYGSLQRWTQKNAFFCQGTYEITTQSESSYSGNLSGGGFYTGYSNSNSSETGDWTIVETDAGPAMIMLSTAGADAALIRIAGNSVYFGEQQFDYQRPQACPGP